MEDESIHQETIAGNKTRREANEPPSSVSSDNDSEFVEDDSSLDSDGKPKSQKQKGKDNNTNVIPPGIDLSGLPVESPRSFVKHRTLRQKQGCRP